MVKAAMIKVLRVHDVMTRDVTTVEAALPVDEAAELLHARRVSGAPVLADGRVVGIVSRTDLLDATRLPREVPLPDVSAVMTRVVYAVRAHDPAMLAVRLMSEEGIHRVIVVGDAGKLAGIVTPMDVLRAIARGQRLPEADGVAGGPGEPELELEYVDLRTL